ncbi:DEKNAAC101052 [Brettanomyces naardenensis]|uniref:DEKNAAC101052 n=1 Tax=Brettanomyces naardenensis TaxID=13370 RepID=A0A448YGZ1_BRENA|nr:DEKNAAC101052 [Brettanomyces naardenensis]
MGRIGIERLWKGGVARVARAKVALPRGEPTALRIGLRGLKPGITGGYFSLNKSDSPAITRPFCTSIRTPSRPFSVLSKSQPVSSLTSYRPASSFSSQSSPSANRYIYISLGVVVAASTYLSIKQIFNESDPSVDAARSSRFDIGQSPLIPDPEGDTFEQGLYLASQRELEDGKSQHRADQMSRKYLGIVFRIAYLVDDYIWEPLVTFGRFCQLTVLFLPVVVVYPIVFFGRLNKNGDRTGALRWYKLVRLAAEAAGASFIKLGQWAASRTDIFSRGMCDELSNLHSNAKSHSFSATRRIIREEFKGLEIEDLFDEFYPTPVGTGAIAQVYLAKLNSSFVRNFVGREDEEEGDSSSHNSLVAVKVEHPKVRQRIERDLKIMKFFARAIDILPNMEWLSFPQEVDQFSIIMRLQLDMRIEAQNLHKFIDNFESHPEVRFPVPRFSSRRVLIEERIQGIGMNKVLELHRNYGKRMSKMISDNVVDAFLKMLILDNFIHADLHPGNIFVRFVKKSANGKKVLSSEFETDELMQELAKLSDEDDKLALKLDELYQSNYRPQVCFIDAGLVTELNDRNRYNFISLFNALSQFDGYKAGELMIERSKTPETAIDADMFKYKVEKLVDRVRQRTFTLGSISIGDILEQMLSMVRVHHVRMEGDFVTVVVAILLLEGIGRQLDPDLDLFARCVYAWYFGVPTSQDLLTE